jgi:hypothetical protein
LLVSHGRTSLPRYLVFKQILAKIIRIAISEEASNVALQQFISANKEYRNAVKVFDSTNFESLNTAIALKTFLFEKDFIKRPQ